MWYLLLLSGIILFFCLVSTTKVRINLYEKNKKIIIRQSDIYFFLIVLILFILTAFRADTVGNDTREYVYIFETISRKGCLDLAWRYEIGYQAFNLLVSKLSTNPQTIIIISSFVMYLAVVVYYKKRCYIPIYAIAIFFALFFSAFTNTIRQCIAYCILLFAYEALKEKKKVASILLIGLAALFQTTALLFVPFAIISLFEIRFISKLFSIVAIVLLGLSLSGNYILSLIIKVVGSYDDYYLRYLSGIRVSSGTAGVTFALSILGLLWCAYAYSVPKEKRNNDIKWLFGFSLLFYILSYVMNSFDRVAGIFEFLLIVPVVNGILESKRKDKKQILLLLIICLIVTFLVKLIFRPEWNMIYPYSFYWK